MGLYQILLYDLNRRLLDSRFLRKDEVIISGESVTFAGHLVDVGECEGDSKLNLEGQNCNLDQKVKAQCESIYDQEKFPIGRTIFILFVELLLLEKHSFLPMLFK